MADNRNKKYLTECNNNPWQNPIGVCFDKDGNATVIFFTFADVTKVFLQIKKTGEDICKYEMVKTKKCIWEIKLDKTKIASGDRYRFEFIRNDETFIVKDPCSMWQDAYFKWSKAYNHNLFNWTDNDWQNGNNPEKVSRLFSENNKLSRVEMLRIYELHIGTFTEEGTFKAAKEKLYDIAHEMHFNAIEIMPVENTYSFNWGYDGVDKYAPNHTYGTPDELKELIDYAHKIGLNVIMDIVPNHLGPDIAQLHLTGPYIEGTNCFGYKFNFEMDSNSSYVRDYIIGSGLNWLINYHCDGLRVDMTKFMCSDFTMKEMAAEINYYSPHSFLIAEDGRDNDNRVTKAFPQNEIEENEYNHNEFIEKLKENSVSLSSLGFDSEWDFPFHKQIASTLLGSWDCWSKNIYNFDNSLNGAQTRVKYVMSHDEIGNIDGTRLIAKIMMNELKLYNNMCDCCHSLRCQLSAQGAHKILAKFLTGELEEMNDQEREDFYKSLSINKNFTVDEIFEAYKKAVNMHKMAFGKIYSIPGPKMVFQGDENANLAYFKFFRKFSTGPEPYLLDKGYKPGMPAFLDSKLSSIKVCDKYADINKAVENFITDLNWLNKENIALSTGYIENTYLNEDDDVHAIHCKKIYNEIFSISNFSNTPFYKNYGVLFPKGKWREILNSDDERYGGEGKYLNLQQIKEQYNYISIPAYGVLFFEKVN